MAIIEPGRPYGRPHAPRDAGYVISEHAELELRQLVEALRVLAMLCDEASEILTDWGPRQTAAVLHPLAERGADLLATAIFTEARR